jgi:hypothetical protein
MTRFCTACDMEALATDVAQTIRKTRDEETVRKNDIVLPLRSEDAGSTLRIATTWGTIERKSSTYFFGFGPVKVSIDLRLPTSTIRSGIEHHCLVGRTRKVRRLNRDVIEIDISPNA